MNRSDLIDELAARFGNLNKNDTDFAANTILDAMGDALFAGRRIENRGFGSFSIRQRLARTRRNPRNGDSVAVPEFLRCSAFYAADFAGSDCETF